MVFLMEYDLNIGEIYELHDWLIFYTISNATFPQFW